MTAVAVVNVVPKADAEGQAQAAQVFRDALKGGPAARQMTGSVVGRTDAVHGDLGVTDPASPQHVGNVLGQQIVVGDDGGAVGRALRRSQCHQFPGQFLDDVGHQQRLAAEPGDAQRFSACGLQQSPGQAQNGLLGLGAHPARAVVFKAIGAVEIAPHRGTEGQRHVGRAARHPCHGRQRRPLVKIDDQPPILKPFQDGMILIQGIQRVQQVQLYRRIRAARSPKQIGHGDPV